MAGSSAQTVELLTCLTRLPLDMLPPWIPGEIKKVYGIFTRKGYIIEVSPRIKNP